MHAYFPLYQSKGRNEDVLKSYTNTLIEMENWLKKNLKGGKFLLGLDHPSMADIHAMPVFERLVFFEGSAFDHIY